MAGPVQKILDNKPTSLLASIAVSAIFFDTYVISHFILIIGIDQKCPI
jgi:hypothetical protein